MDHSRLDSKERAIPKNSVDCKNW